jgi:hypothetical protein
MASANGQPLLSGTIKLQETGKWTADLEIDTALEGDEEDAFPVGENGRVAIRIEHNGAVFACTVESGDRRGERFQCRVVGGAGGLETKLSAKSYLSQVGITLGQLIGDVLKDAGETLSATVTDATKNRKLPRWTRAEGTAERALAALTKATEQNWRVLPDGTVWVGVDTFPEADIDAVVIDTNPTNGTLELAAGEEDDSPGPLLLEPGTTYNGSRILEVRHELGAAKFRTFARASTLKRVLDRILEGKQQEIDYSRVYGAEVVGQNEDGTLELRPDTDLVKGGGLSKVPVLLGVPGSVQVPAGARCTVLWEGGDPTKPRALLFSTTALSLLMIGGGAQFVALANLCDARFDAIESKINSMVTGINSHVHTGVTTGGGSSGPPAAPQGSISPGNSVAASKLKTD